MAVVASFFYLPVMGRMVSVDRNMFETKYSKTLGESLLRAAKKLKLLNNLIFHQGDTLNTARYMV